MADLPSNDSIAALRNDSIQRYGSQATNRRVWEEWQPMTARWKRCYAAGEDEAVRSAARASTSASARDKKEIEVSDGCARPWRRFMH